MALTAVFACCSSDPEGPVTSVFLEEGSYTPKAGETVRYIDTLSSLTVVDIPVGIGKSSLLRLGEYKNIRFESILMKFDFDSLSLYEDKTVDSVLLDLPLVIIQDTLFHLQVTFNELLEGFNEDDTLTSVPLFILSPIEGGNGETVRDINIERTDFSIDALLVQGWLDGGAPWPYGIAINWAVEPDTLGLLEMKSTNYGSDPPVLRVIFTDMTEAVFPVIEDYTITSYNGDGIDCVGGVATRLFFEFSLDGIPEDAMVHYSALVLHTDGSGGLGATGGDMLFGLTQDFIYYVYAPALDDISDPDFLFGTGVATNVFVPTVSKEVKIPLVGFVPDILAGLRENMGLVFQSNQENSRFQKAAFYNMAAGDSLRPYIEVIYTMPADFSGE